MYRCIRIQMEKYVEIALVLTIKHAPQTSWK